MKISPGKRRTKELGAKIVLQGQGALKGIKVKSREGGAKVGQPCAGPNPDWDINRGEKKPNEGIQGGECLYAP